MKTKVKDYLEQAGVIKSLGESLVYDYIHEAAADQIPNAHVSGGIPD